MGRDPAVEASFGQRLGCIPRFLAVLNARRAHRLHADAIDDLAQDVAVSILEQLPIYRGEARLETWIWRVCRDRLLNRIRDERRRNERLTSLEQVGELRRGPERPEESVELAAALRRLPRDMYAVVYLKSCHGLTFPEIAELVHWPLGTVKTLYYRGLSRLRDNLGSVAAPRASAQDLRADPPRRTH